jgi:hypothetical protein
MQTELQFKIVVVYENLQAALRARQMSERLATELRHEGGIHCALWKYNLLAEPSLRSQATTEAAAAGMVIVSASSTEVPVHLKCWIEDWPAPTHQNRAALVVMLDDHAEQACQTAPITSYVREVARARGADFFCKAGGWWRHDWEPIGDFFGCRPKIQDALAYSAPGRYVWPGGDDLARAINQLTEPKLPHASIKQIQHPGFPRTNFASRPQTLGTSGPP